MAVQARFIFGAVVRLPFYQFCALAVVVIVHGPHHFAIQAVVDKITVGVGHDVLSVLRGLGAVAGGAVIGADDYVDPIAVVVEGIGVIFGAQRMAFVATDNHLLQRFVDIFRGQPPIQRFLNECCRGCCPAVTAFLPGGHQAGMQFAVAAEALLCFSAERDILPVDVAGSSKENKNEQGQLREKPFHGVSSVGEQ
jgi:hypothetical protein